MCKRIKIILNPDEAITEEMNRLLEPCRESIEMEITDSGQGLLMRGTSRFPKVPLPLIITDESDRFHGIKGVKEFVYWQTGQKV